MRIKYANIISFGKFSGLRIDFSRRMTVICGGNEAGKSTVASFIRAMLFGVKRCREAYTPWGGGAIAGELVIETEGREIVIYRSDNGKTETVSFTDAATGEAIDALPDDIYGFSEEEFAGALFLHLDEHSSPGEKMTKKLTNLSESGSETLSFDRLAKLLDSRRKDLKHVRGRGGKIDELEDEIERLKAEMERSKEAANALLSDCIEKERLTKLRGDAAQRLDEMRRLEIERERQLLYSSLKTRESEFDKTQSDLDFAASELNSAKEALAKEKECAPRDDRAKLQKSFRRNLTAAIILFVLCAAVVTFSLVMKMPLFLIAGAALLLGALAALFFAIRDNRKYLLLDAALDESNEKISVISGTISVLEKNYAASRAAMAKSAASLDEIKSEIFKKYGEIEDIEPRDVPFDAEEKRDLESQERDLTARILSLEAKLGADNHRSAEEIAGAIKTLKEERKAAKSELDTVNLIMAAASDAQSAMKKSFLPRLRALASEYFCALTKGSHAGMLVGDDFSLSVSESGTHVISDFSTATADQAYLALRLGLAALLHPQGDAPIILDDSFSHYDKSRFSAAKNLLADISQSRQVIIFSCRPKEDFEGDIDIIELK